MSTSLLRQTFKFGEDGEVERNLIPCKGELVAFSGQFFAVKFPCHQQNGVEFQESIEVFEIVDKDAISITGKSALEVRL